MASAVKTAAKISFQTELFNSGSMIIARLPEIASKQLPSRSQIMAEGTLDGVSFHTPLEPDGRLSHWFAVDAKLLKEAGVHEGDLVQIELTSTNDWPEPPVPADLKQALGRSKKASELWKNITPLARWEWVRWTRATGNTETRQRRINVGISKLEHGERRPCCWNRNLCTEPSVSKSGMLILPESFTEH